jgi:hypothetical protein
MKRRFFVLGLGAVAGGLALTGVARGAALASGQFTEELLVSDRRLKLIGTGLYYYRLFIKAAEAALYLDPQSAGNDVLADVAKRLEMHYFWGVTAEKLIAGSRALLRRNLPEDTRVKLNPQIEEMFQLYRDVSRGDRCAFTYLPGEGTTLLHNGERLGTVPGAEFAAAYFSMWFGDKPLDAGLKRKLLGG